MHYFVMSLIANTIIVITAAPTASASGFDFTSLLPLLGVLIGGLVSATTSFFLSKYWPLRSNRTVNNVKKAKWLVGLAEGFVTPPVIRSLVL